MLNTRITVRQAIVKVSTMEWLNQKNGALSIKNAERFALFYGFDNFMNDVATENVREFKHHCKTILSYKHGTINRKLAALSKLCTMQGE